MNMKRRMYGTLYFSIGIGLACICLGPSFAADVQQEVPQVSSTPVFAQSLKVSVDFVETSVSDVAYFVTQQTGIGFTFSLPEPKNINWSQFGMDKDDLISNFDRALSTVGLTCRPVDDKKLLYEITGFKWQTSLERLSSMKYKDKVFLFFDDKLYLKDEFPHPLQNISGSWYAQVSTSSK